MSSDCNSLTCIASVRLGTTTDGSNFMYEDCKIPLKITRHIICKKGMLAVTLVKNAKWTPNGIGRKCKVTRKHHPRKRLPYDKVLIKLDAVVLWNQRNEAVHIRGRRQNFNHGKLRSVENLLKEEMKNRNEAVQIPNPKRDPRFSSWAVLELGNPL